MQVKGLRAQADKLNKMAMINEMVLERERLRHAQSFLEQQASYTRIGKSHRPVPVRLTVYLNQGRVL